MMESYFMEKMAELKQQEIRKQSKARVWEDLEYRSLAPRRGLTASKWRALMLFGAWFRR